MQRYSCDGYMDQTDDGAWVEHSDAAALIAAKDAEIAELNRRLALAVAEVRSWRACKGFTNERVFWAAAWSWEDGNCVLSTRSSTDADPVLREMVEKGSV